METIDEIKESQPVSTHQLLRKVYKDWHTLNSSNLPGSEIPPTWRTRPSENSNPKAFNKTQPRASTTIQNLELSGKTQLFTKGTTPRDDWLHRGPKLQDMDYYHYSRYVHRIEMPRRGDAAKFQKRAGIYFLFDAHYAPSKYYVQVLRKKTAYRANCWTFVSAVRRQPRRRQCHLPRIFLLMHSLHRRGRVRQSFDVPIIAVPTGWRHRSTFGNVAKQIQEATRYQIVSSCVESQKVRDGSSRRPRRFEAR